MPLVIIDDCPLNLAILKRLASSKGAREVVTFSDPVAGLEWLVAHAARIVIVDLSMDGMDGIELVRRVRAGGRNQTTPIVMVTGSEDPGARAQAIAAGAQDFLEKPIDVAQYKTVISGLLQDGGWPIIDRREAQSGTAPAERRATA
jgi:CheY-like chemotaxis protein